MASAKILLKWEYIEVVRAYKFDGWGTYGPENITEHFVIKQTPDRTFPDVSTALATLGSEGWDCFHMERRDGYMAHAYSQTLYLKRLVG